jgi:hypothetical protein
MMELAGTGAGVLSVRYLVSGNSFMQYNAMQKMGTKE